jgi:hypothetical protein
MHVIVDEPSLFFLQTLALIVNDRFIEVASDPVRTLTSSVTDPFNFSTRSHLLVSLLTAQAISKNKKRHS